MKKAPLISCLCVSSHRPEFLKRAIAYFLAQTYEEKELIIVSREKDPEYESIVNGYPGSMVRYAGLGVSPDMTLGELRNISIEMSGGSYFCIWDDDDWYHHRRLEVQYEETARSCKKGSILAYCIQYNEQTDRAFISDPIFLPGSILCDKECMTNGILYPSLNTAEDTIFLKGLIQANFLFPIINPTLYIYRYHGGNTVSLKQFGNLSASELSSALSLMVKDIIEGAYSCEKASELLDSRSVLEQLNYFNKDRIF
jgi:glycosyltransferase involved in cell wall biosynthesis